MKTRKQLTAVLLSVALLCGMMPAGEAEAAKKPALSAKKLTVAKGAGKTLKVKNAPKSVKWKVLSGQKCITVKKKGKTAVTIKGKKKGKAKVQATAGKIKLKCTVTVTDAGKEAKASAQPANTDVDSQPTAPMATDSLKPTGSAAPTATDDPAVTTTDNPTPTDDPAATQKPDDISELRTVIYDGTNSMEIKSLDERLNEPYAVIVKEGVTKIGKSAFFGCSELASITIPASVTSIERSAFSECSGLASITISENNSKYDSRENCNAIIETESNRLIVGCKNTKIPDNVTSIGESAFSECRGLSSIIISDNVTSIGRHAFFGCRGLTDITVSENNGKYDSRENCNAIIETESNVLIVGCKNTKIPDNVVSIGEHAFTSCRELTSLTIPASVTSIGEGAFSGCSGLIGITIPNSVTSIEESVFSGCSGLVSMAISASVTSIGEKAFSGCSGLASITIPASVTSIGEEAFSGCSGLTDITVSENNSKYDSRENCNAIIETESNALIAGCENTKIPASVTSIGEGAFLKCSGLTDIAIPDGVISIGGSAFSKCSGLTSITIPASVTSIGERAFSGCSGLTGITIPDSVTSIGELAFYSGLTSITWNGTEYTSVDEFLSAFEN